MFREEQHSIDHIHRILRHSQAKFDIIEMFLQLDEETRLHCYRVSQLSRSIVKNLNHDSGLVQHIELAAFLHDIGKLAIAPSILKKPTTLTLAERELIQMHPEIGAQICAKFNLSQSIVSAIYSHHEHFNGMGYPLGISGPAIPFLSRIISIADAVDAMVSQRHYSQARPLDEAIRTIILSSGSQFDPWLVSNILKTIDLNHSNNWMMKQLSTH